MIQDTSNTDRNNTGTGTESTDTATNDTHTSSTNTPDWSGSFAEDLVFEATEFERAFPEMLNERERWMGAASWAKNPFAPWSDEDAPAPCSKHDTTADECDCNAQWKWGWEEHYITGPEVDRAALGTDITNRAYIFAEDDEFLFADLDDVRCPETGKVHPVAVAFLALLGPTWVEVSRSGTGLHAVYVGELPGDMAQATPTIDDEPWGAITPDDDEDNADVLPQIELYDAKRKPGVLTGKTVPGAPIEVRECDGTVVEAFLEAHGEVPDPDRPEDYTPEEFRDMKRDTDTSDGVDADVTDDVEELYSAIDSLDARDVADQTIVREWLDPPGTEHRAFVPTWAPSGYKGQAVYCTDEKFVDTGKRGGWGGPVIMAAIDKRMISDGGAEPGDVTGEDFADCVDHLRSLGFSIPEYVPDGDSSQLYIDVLGGYAEPGEDPYQDPDDCLMASLRAKEDDAVPADADPPTLAVNALIEHAFGYPPGSDFIDDGARGFARDLFAELTPPEAREEFGLNGGDTDE